MNKKVNLFDLTWYIVGLVIYGFTSLIYSVVATRFIGVSETGFFTFAYAVAFSFFTIGSYFGKSFQITDTSKRNTDLDYVHSKIITCSLMLILTLLFCLFKSYELDKIMLIAVLTIYRCADAFVESYHAIIQKHDRSYKVGISVFVRTILLTIGFILSVIITKNIIISSVVIAIINVLFIFIVDYNLARKYIDKGKFNIQKNIVLLIEGFSVLMLNFLNIYVLNSSKYAIDRISNNYVQGIFGIVVLPASFVSLVCLYLVHPFLNRVTELLESKKVKKLHLLIVKISLAVLGVGVLSIAVANFIGIPVLETVYGVRLENQKINLLIILFASTIYSLYSILSQVLIAMRKNLYQVVCLFINLILSIIICNYCVSHYDINGACIAYLIVMTIQFVLILLGYIYYSFTIANSKKKVTIRLMGGLGNQMFEYAAMRNIQLNNNSAGVIDLVGITNKTHNVYGLDHCNISKDIGVINKKGSIKARIAHLLYGFYWVFLAKSKRGFQFWSLLQPYLNSIGIYCVPDGYIRLEDMKIDNNYMVGYFQSIKYMNENKDIIRDELQITDKLTKKNQKVYEEILKSNSVCVHIRRGDYVGSFFEVCNAKYYLDSIKYIQSKIKNAHFYIFSDDIDWAKENLGLKNVTYIDWKNDQFQDLKLMSGCKNFIMSNSSFSYWAQFLSQNKKKVVLAPSKWFKNGKKIDIYDDDWVLMNVD